MFTNIFCWFPGIFIEKTTFGEFVLICEQIHEKKKFSILILTLNRPLSVELLPELWTSYLIHLSYKLSFFIIDPLNRNFLPNWPLSMNYWSDWLPRYILLPNLSLAMNCFLIDPLDMNCFLIDPLDMNGFLIDLLDMNSFPINPIEMNCFLIYLLAMNYIPDWTTSC